MLIVYQSLESTGTKDDTSSTFITGNSFKRGVHGALRVETSFNKTRVWDGDKVVFETAKMDTPFASTSQSEKLSKTIRDLDDKERNDTAIAILSKIVERIVDNASTCTCPEGNVRPYVRLPDVIVFGECYATSLLNQVLAGYVVVGGINPTGDARHRFMVLARTGLDGKTPAPGITENFVALLSVGGPDSKNKDETSKCMLLKVRGWLIACVHTPNSICNDPDRAALYLHNNAQRFGDGSKLDLVMGDTNQGSSDTVRSYMNGAYNRIVRKGQRTTKPTVGDTNPLEEMTVETWDHSIMSSGKQVIRGYINYEVSGTNSKYTTHFDIACTSRSHVQLNGLTVHEAKQDEMRHTFHGEEPAFFFHGLTDKFVEYDGLFYAYSDHNGVIVEILRDKEEFRVETESKKRKSRIEEEHETKRKKLEESQVIPYVPCRCGLSPCLCWMWTS